MRRLLIVALIAVLSLATACSRSKHDEAPLAAENQDSAEMNQMNHDGHDASGHAASGTSHIQTEAVWKLSDEKPQAGKTTAITVQINDGKGKPVAEFDFNHEKQMHLIIVSRDLAYFDHIHPIYNGNGQFQVETDFPAGGDYKLIADYVPTGGSAVNNSTWISVLGSAGEAKPIEPDKSLVKTFNGVEVTLSYGHLMAGMDLELNFHMTDANTHEPVTDLEPYLGAVGHVVILSADAEQYLHVHPTEEKAKGPDAAFMTRFPESGIYKVWGQFQREGKTFVVPFVIDVP
ncbi:hypothetical protein ACFOLF_02730 [Paenibacillus sepulcri]|uniref:Secreted protein n=1 Tax=Paenibacillus sepulcri TaxID=359917 RepID=A0ABS7CAM5_9BACL|nr:hypothetical protein [Paenibacillus sepulcri]